MLFSGAYEHNIDTKNRLAIPSPVRAALEEMGLGKKLYVAMGTRPRTLALWPEEHFKVMAQQLPRSPIPDLDQLQYEQFFFSTAHGVELDSQGRILIPDGLRDLSEIGAKVSIIGVYDHLEIWNQDEYKQFIVDNREQFLTMRGRARQSVLASGPVSPPAQRGQQ
jgi:MraZ protein